MGCYGGGLMFCSSGAQIWKFCNQIGSEICS